MNKASLKCDLLSMDTSSLFLKYEITYFAGEKSYHLGGVSKDDIQENLNLCTSFN